AGTTPWPWEPAQRDTALYEAVEAQVGEKLKEAYAIVDKLDRRNRIAELRAEVVEALTAGDSPAYTEAAVAAAFGELEYNIVRKTTLQTGRRIDGRDTETIRPISI